MMVDAPVQTAPTPVHRSRRRQIIRIIDLTVWMTAGIAAVIIAALVLIYGVQFSRVLSPSMAPGMPVGSVAVTAHVPTDSLKVGQVAILRTPGENALYIHRIISMQVSPQGLVIQTKGDANPSPDPWTVTLPSEQVDVLVFVLPTQRITDIALHLQPIAIPLFLFGILMTAYFGWYAMRRSDVQPAKAAPSEPHFPDNDFNV